VTLFIDFFKYFLGEEFRAGLDVVPILLLANLCLGIYVNLSIWYKLTDRTLMGASVSLAGALLTIGLNVWWIPVWGYVGSAWATLACYAGMAIASYLLGRRYYPVAYEVKRVLAYIALGIILYLARVQLPVNAGWQPWLLSVELMSLYLLIVALFERRLIAATVKPENGE
jgi:O-antigen/teichoic acid export membrane protein